MAEITKENAALIADKKFGQNFLQDETVLKKIVEAMPNDTNDIVEIGPGLGDLTRQSIQVKQNVKAYEVDTRLCKYLKNEFKEAIESGKFELICKDIMEKDGSLHNKEYNLVANLPYYIATNIILKALHDSNCKTILVMVQREVAQKFAAKPGDKNFGSLAILSQSVAKVEHLFDVPPEAFEPPPKVTSAILKIEKEKSLDDKDFEQFLRIATKQPRKTLYKNLSASYDKTLLKELFKQANIPLNIRPHELELSVYHHLYNRIKDEKDGERKQKGRE